VVSGRGKSGQWPVISGQLKESGVLIGARRFCSVVIDEIYFADFTQKVEAGKSFTDH
jgi:hypothetical protein